MICRASLTTLNLSFDGNLPERVEPLLLRLLNGLTAIEHLDLAWISETIIETGDPVDLVQAMLVNKQKLVSLVFPEDTFLYKHEVDNFLSRVGRDRSIPSLRIINSGADWSTFVHRNTSAPYFGSSLAAARFVDRLPSLEHLSIGIQDSRRVPGAPTSGDDPQNPPIDNLRGSWRSERRMARAARQSQEPRESCARCAPAEYDIVDRRARGLLL
jgi:hypothetical protein